MRSFQLKYLMAAACLSFPFSGFSYEFKPVTLPELVGRAQEIVVGQVVRQYSQWDEEKKEIYTFTHLKVSERVKSNGGADEIVMRHLGGKVGDIESHVQGMPSFEEGERVLLFLGSYQGTPYFGLIDWRMGKYVIQTRTDKKSLVRGTLISEGAALRDFINQLKSYL